MFSSAGSINEPVKSSMKSNFWYEGKLQFFRKAVICILPTNSCWRSLQRHFCQRCRVDREFKPDSATFHGRTDGAHDGAMWSSPELSA